MRAAFLSLPAVSTSGELRQNLRECKDKYKYVNVTVVKGHTRTLAVPLSTADQKTTSLGKLQREPLDKQVVAKRKSIDEPERTTKVLKQDAATSTSSTTRTTSSETKLKDREYTARLPVSPRVTPAAINTVASPSNTTCENTATINQNNNACIVTTKPSYSNGTTANPTAVTTQIATLVQNHSNQT